ncbi:DUF3040 domain-containing protein [Sphaerospermopsis aphanizomenoides BCCUSP55]|uniref:DUF3040 domain-containing protein n=1 Tax=Sphaerospermopsis aphanizomenoides TaxID=459663 RepID=UPI000AD1504E|nr:DUF3040 domain-containing protein [Sphaerospermopsis aphanizomenoides]MBK1990511.1 DUF3040 domain-containing protein [Sphaerospermopsis aphanizomenoides BCCUSP55]
MASQDEHNRELQRKVEMRLREMEDRLHASEAPFYETQKHQPENSQKPWMRKAILGVKLFGLAVAALVAVRIASVLAGFVIFGALAFLVYKLFLESKFKNLQ